MGKLDWIFELPPELQEMVVGFYTAWLHGRPEGPALRDLFPGMTPAQVFAELCP